MDSQCATGQRCNTATSMCEAAAATSCTMDSQCAAGQRCNTATSMCEAAPATRCSMDTDCPTTTPRCNTVTTMCEQVTICTNDSGCPPAMPRCIANLCSAITPGNNMTTPNTTNPTNGTAPGACVDQTAPGRAVSDCGQNAMLCNNAIYFDLMSQQCPATCGRCQQAGTGGAPSGTAGCDDLSQAGRASDCPASAHLCNNAVYRPLMAVQCRRTCGLCGAGVQGANTNGTVPVAVGTGCSDKALPGKASDCPSVRHLCSDSRYVSVMRDQCAMTCGFCGGK